MKQLFWKEWYELRLLPLASAVCVMMLILGIKVYNRVYEPTHRVTIDDNLLPLAATWALFGLLAGAGLIAQEVGSGGLQFLSALPTSRRRLWWVKVASGLGMLLLSVISSIVTWMVVDAFLFRAAFFNFLGGITTHLPWLVQSAGGPLLVLLGFFTVGLAVSPFLDRPISAVVAALLISIAYIAALQDLATLYVNYYGRLYGWQESDPHVRSGDWLLVLLCALSIFVFATVSYWTFTRGESLRSARRFRVGAVAGLVSLTVAGLVFLTGNQALLW